MASRLNTVDQIVSCQLAKEVDMTEGTEESELNLEVGLRTACGHGRWGVQAGLNKRDTEC